VLIKFSSIVVLLVSIGLFPTFSLVYGDAEIKGNTGAIMFDRNTYPLPDKINDLEISIRLFDPDFNKSPNGIDKISEDLLDEPGVGPVKISIIRGDSVVLGYAGGTSSNNGPLDSKPIEVLSAEKSLIRQFGPILETSPTSGIFEFELVIKNIDGPESSKCPVSNNANLRFDDATILSRHCILQGDVLLVEFTDPSDVSGNPRTVTDSATFTIQNPSTSFGSGSEKITSSKIVRIGHPMTLLLYDSNLNLDSERAETYTLDLIQFESKNIRTTLGPAGGVQKEFNPQPSALRETGDNTGIFYTVIEVPRTVNGKRIDVNEKIEFEYTQRGLGAFLSLHQGTFSSKLTSDITESFSINVEDFRTTQFDDISCKEMFVKIFKYNGSPACVKPKTAEKLVERGWARPNL